MKKMKTLMLIATLLAIPAIAQAELKTQEMKSIKMAASRPAAFNGVGVVQEFTGNFGSVANSFDVFSNEFKKQKLQSRPGQPALLILLEDPTGKSEFHYLVGYTVEGTLEPKAPLQLHQMNHPQAMRVTHVGDYNEMEEVHTALRSRLREVEHQKDTKFPVVMRLLNDPRTVAPAQRKTELIVPVR